MAYRSSTTAANPPRASSNTTFAPCWRGSSDAGAGSAATATRSPATFRVAPSRALTVTPRTRLTPSAPTTSCRAQVDPLDLHPHRDQRLLERRRGRRRIQDDHPAFGRHRANAPPEREPAAGPRRDHPRAIVVGERQVLIVAAGRVQRPLRARAQQAIGQRDRQDARARRRRPGPPGSTRSPSRRRPPGPRRRGPHRPARVPGRRRPPRPAASRPARTARRTERRVLSAPPRATARAAESPAGPAPMMQTSSSSSSTRARGVRRRVRERSRATHLPHQLQEHRVAGARAGHHRVVIHALREQPVGGRQHVDVDAGQRVLPRTGEARSHRRHTGALVRPPVDAQVTGGAVPVEAEQPARPVVFGRAGQGEDARRVQRDRDRLTLPRRAAPRLRSRSLSRPRPHACTSEP